jgi:hypothetical protein
MARLVRCLLILFMVTAAVSSLLIVQPTYAQSSKPSPPEFTIQMPNDSTIQLIIQNQAFTNSSSVNAIVYYYRVKDHYSQQWVINRNYLLQSDSQTTTFTIPPHPGDFRDYLFPPNNLLNNSSLLDFQVQAVTGYYLVTYVDGQMPGTPIQTDGYSEITFDESETSDWSSTRTITIDSSTSSSPTQTAPDNSMEPSPSVPEFPFLLVIPFLLSAIAIALIVKMKKLAYIGNRR